MKKNSRKKTPILILLLLKTIKPILITQSLKVPRKTPPKLLFITATKKIIIFKIAPNLKKKPEK